MLLWFIQQLTTASLQCDALYPLLAQTNQTLEHKLNNSNAFRQKKEMLVVKNKIFVDIFLAVGALPTVWEPYNCKGVSTPM